MIEALPELIAFRAAASAHQNASASDLGNKRRLWLAAYSDHQAELSPLYRLRRAIRDVVKVNAEADSSVSPLDRESTYRTLVSQLAGRPDAPPTVEEEAAALEELARIALLS